jgi:hypothetical protein
VIGYKDEYVTVLDFDGSIPSRATTRINMKKIDIEKFKECKPCGCLKIICCACVKCYDGHPLHLCSPSRKETEDLIKYIEENI